MKDGLDFNIDRKEKDYVTEGEQPSFLFDAQFAFSKKVARQIGKRAGWACEVTGKRFQDSFLMHMCHDHDAVQHGDPDYNNPDFGRCCTVDTHLKEHIVRFQSGLESDTSFIKIAREAYKNGLRTHRYYHFNPEGLEEDRRKVRDILHLYDINAIHVLLD